VSALRSTATSCWTLPKEQRRYLGEPLVRAGILFGVGLGGFAYGLLLPRLLGWHTHTDGAWWLWAAAALSVLGLVLLVRATRRPGPRPTGAVVGSTLTGFGACFVAEGLLNHHVLATHHVRPGHPSELLWDLGFLAFGALIAVVGWSMVRAS
jgi:uncharacterized membrane protein